MIHLYISVHFTDLPTTSQKKIRQGSQYPVFCNISGCEVIIVAVLLTARASPNNVWIIDLQPKLKTPLATNHNQGADQLAINRFSSFCQKTNSPDSLYCIWKTTILK